MKTKLLTCLAVIGLLISGCKKNQVSDADAANTIDSTVVVKDTMTVIPHEPVVPGKSLGITSIGDKTEAAVGSLGDPLEGDAAMGKSVATYKIDDNGEDATLTFFSARNLSDEKSIVQVQIMRTNAKKFKTENQLGVGSSLMEIEKFFALEKVGKFIENKNNYTIYDTNAGIAFEIGKDKICHGIVIHPIEKQTNAMYLPLYDNFTEIEGIK